MMISVSPLAGANSKALPLLALGLFALDLKLDQGLATVVVAALVAISSMWQSWTLSKVHTAVNSNFSEARAARLAAEAALKTSKDLNTYLQQQLDLKAQQAQEAVMKVVAALPASSSGAGEATAESLKNIDKHTEAIETNTAALKPKQ